LQASCALRAIVGAPCAFQAGRVHLGRVGRGRARFDEVAYPDIDNHAKAGADGKYVHTRKDGTLLDGVILSPGKEATAAVTGSPWT
jgi:hypothetical protein